MSARTLLLALACVAACNKKKSEPQAEPPVVVVTQDAAGAGTGTDAAATDIAFGTDETYFGGTRSATNFYAWKLEDGTTLQLVIVGIGPGADGRQRGVLRVYRDGKPVDVGSSFSIATSGDHWAELKQLANGSVLFRYGDASEDRRARNAVLLRYDNDAKEVRIVKRWAGRAKAQEPDWIVAGTYKPADNLGDACAKVVARMVACAKDPAFRAALVARDDEPARAGVLATFDDSVVKWKSPAETKRQCERWASDDYVDITFGDKVKLDHLATEASAPKVSCEFFGAEIVDEGGIPRLAAGK